MFWTDLTNDRITRTQLDGTQSTIIASSNMPCAGTRYTYISFFAVYIRNEHYIGTAKCVC